MKNIYRLLVMIFAFGILGSLGAYETNSVSFLGALMQAAFCGISLKILFKLEKAGLFNKKTNFGKKMVKKRIISKAA